MQTESRKKEKEKERKRRRKKEREGERKKEKVNGETDIRFMRRTFSCFKKDFATDRGFSKPLGKASVVLGVALSLGREFLPPLLQFASDF